MFEKIMEILKAPTVRRLLVFVVGLGTVVLNRRFGLDLSAEQIVGDVVLTLGYLGQSAFTDASKVRSAALVEAGVQPIDTQKAFASATSFSDSKPTPPMRPQSP